MTQRHRRLFIAMPVTGKAALFLEEKLGPLRQHGRLLKIVPPENYHITLKFMGQTDGDTADKIIKGFADVSWKKSAIGYEIKGLGAFPGLSRPSVIWAGLRVSLPAVREIQTAIEDFAGTFGFEKEQRSFKPHLTLARVRRDMAVPGELKDFIRLHEETLFGESLFDRVVLYESVLGRDGAAYHELKSIEFG